MKQFNSDSSIMLRGVLVIISSVNFYSSVNATTVLTRLGKITGFYKNSYEGNKYEAFEGIPYAQPPLGDRRFEPPEVIGPWQDELQATKIRKHCWGFDREVYPWGNYLDGDEDCLYLNVYRPINKGKTSLLPVIFDIHGGGFQYGTVLPEAARYLIEHDIIFVSIHYRLGILGFLSTEDDVIPGNMGLKDQSMALKWTKENIKSFGGDPNRITLTGLSAGGASVHYHYLSPMSKGLFHSGISFSGTALNSWALIRNSRKRALALGKLMDCTTDNNHSMVQMVQCLKTVPARTLTKAITFFKPWRLMPLVPFGPVVEKSNKSVFIDRFPIEIIESGNVYDAPWITGVVSEEGLYPVAEFIQNETALKEVDENWNSVAPLLLDYGDSIMYNTPHKDLFELGDIAQMIRKHYFGDNAINKENLITFVHLEGDRLFQVDAVKAATEQANVNRNPVWFYLYSYRATNSLSEATSNSTENFGVCHGDDVYMVLGNDEIIPSKTERDMSMHENLVKLWISVAHKGVPDVGVNWLSVDRGKKNFNYLHIAGPGNINLEITDDFGQKSFWNTIDFG